MELQKEGEEYVWIPLEEIESDEIKLRPADIAIVKEIANSAKVEGILEPIEVRPIGKNRYKITYGEHRFQAAIEAGVEKIRCKVKAVDEVSALERKLIENLQRNGYVDPVVEGQIFKRLIDEKYHSASILAITLGKTYEYVLGRLTIEENLIPKWKEKLKLRKLTLREALDLSRSTVEVQENYDGKGHVDKPIKRVMAKTKRSAEMIMFEMMEAIDSGKCPLTTQLMYALNLSWKTMVQYRKELVEIGCLKEADYSVTDEGKEILSYWKLIRDKLQIMRQNYKDNR